MTKSENNVDLRHLREENFKITKEDIRKSVNEDNFIVQTISNIVELESICNKLSKRLREWYALYCPEFEASIESNKKFAELILKKSRKKLLDEINIKGTMGADLSEEDLDEIKLLADEISSLFLLKKKHEDYLSKMMEKYCPNIQALAGTTIAAKLIENVGSLKRLAMLPASTIQMLGAEKALFRHIKDKKHKPPKYGLIFSHQLISGVKKKDQGIAARALADKISIAVRVDYFKGEYVADNLIKELEERFGRWK